MTYRADVDGLRAVAVMSVLLFHLGTAGFSGGFLGVDVFFVISGYLICGIIDGQLRAGTFSLARFYKRRILRIVPALLVMMVATSALALHDFLPVELRDYAWSLVAATLSVSNMYFAYTAGYFDPPALTKPLLHTWSLGVEEQFYIAVPPLMMLVARVAPRHMRAAAVTAAVASVALAILGAFHSPAKAFYLAPCRAWEFLLGALLALGPVRPAGARGRNLMGLLGLAAILGAVTLASNATPVLVLTAVASLGAALVIASGAEGQSPSLVSRLLTWEPVRVVGLASYSVYLWHWPLIVFVRSGALLPGDLPGSLVSALVILASLGLGTLSWRFVETPFRTAVPRVSGRAVFAGAAAAAAVLSGCGLLVVARGGLPSRFPPEVDRLAAYLDYDPAATFRQGRCYLDNDRESLDEATCLHVVRDRPNDLLVGDSFAAHLWYGLSRTMPGVNILQATMGGCRPFAIPATLFESGACPRLRHRVFDEFLPRTKIDKVLLAGAWKDEDIAPLLRTIDTLRARGQNVTVLGPLVEYQQPLPRLLADELRRGDPGLASRRRDPTVPARDRAMKALVTARGAEYVSLYDAACPGGTCPELTPEGVPVQFDTGHLTAEGSVAVAKRLEAVVALAPLGRAHARVSTRAVEPFSFTRPAFRPPSRAAAADPPRPAGSRRPC